VEYAQTYYPSTLSIGEATPLRIRQGEELTGIEIVLARRPWLFTIRGTVLDASGQPVSGAHVRVERNFAEGLAPLMVPAGAIRPAAQPTNERGEFEIPGVPAGDNALSAIRYGADGVQHAWMPMAMIAEDLIGVTVRLQPAVSISGRVIFEGTPPASRAALRISSIPGRNMGGSAPSSVQPDEEGSFLLEHQFGPTLIRADGLRGWHLKAVQLGARDITDHPTEFVPGGPDLQVILSRRRATLAGTVTRASGPGLDAAVLLFSQDPARWHERFSTTKLAYTDGGGGYRVEGLRPGSYLAVAVTRDDASLSDTTPAYFELLAKAATPAVLADGEQKSLNLAIVPLR
jgi:hypothetical protein